MLSRRDYSPRLDRHDRRDLRNLAALAVHLREYAGRIVIALSCLVLAKIAGIGVPLVLKEIIDSLDATLNPVVVLPLVLLAAYGGLRIAGALFNELRDSLFARVRYRAMRRLTMRTLNRLHALSLRFHLERRVGAISRDLQRAAGGLSSLLNYLVFSVLPVVVELGLVIAILLVRYRPVFAVVVLASMATYMLFTIMVSNWRMDHRHETNRLESQANNEAMESLMNYETVKYFGSEEFEAERCDRTLGAWEEMAVRSITSQSLLNFGQGAIIALGVTAIMLFAAADVVAGRMTIGDLVLVNALLLQMFIPLGVLGIVYRQIRYALVDMDLLVRLLDEEPEVRDREGAQPLTVDRGEVRFEQVSFAYRPGEPILHGIDLTIAPGTKVAVVGPSGAGKSTLARLLFRFYDVTEGRITIDGQDIRAVTQASLRAAIGIVPQDTVLFNESLYYNLVYARPGATPDEVCEAARVAQIHDFITGLPEGYGTTVGDRGLKLSGGERQRIAIARAVLKNPRILVFDEATSALDSRVEREILRALRAAAADHTTLVIAHRLSTVVDADRILVMERGRIVESGTHTELLAACGVYAGMWEIQQREDGGADS